MGRGSFSFCRTPTDEFWYTLILHHRLFITREINVDVDEEELDVDEESKANLELALEHAIPVLLEDESSEESDDEVDAEVLDDEEDIIATEGISKKELEVLETYFKKLSSRKEKKSAVCKINNLYLHFTPPIFLCNWRRVPEMSDPQCLR